MRKNIIITGSMLMALVLGIIVVQQPTRLSNQASEIIQDTMPISPPVNACPNILWECAIPSDLHIKFRTDAIDYRLVVRFQNSDRIERGVLNFPNVQFKPDSGNNFTCNLEVVDRKGNLLICDSYSGRQACIKPPSSSIPSTQPSITFPTTANVPTPVPFVTTVIRDQTNRQFTTKKSTCTQTSMDFNTDGTISTIDAGYFIQKYLANNFDADLNCDGSLDRLDWDMIKSARFGKL